MNVLLTTFYNPDHMGVLLLAAYLREKGHTVTVVALKRDVFQVFDARVLESLDTVDDGYLMYSKNTLFSTSSAMRPITERELELFTDILREKKPALVCLSTRSPINYLLSTIVPVIRNTLSSVPIVAGGFGPTLEPESVFGAGVDFIIRGEGEEALLELVTALEGGSWNPGNIRNLSWREAETIIHNPLRPLEKNLDKYPFPLPVNAPEIELIEENVRLRLSPRTPEWPTPTRSYSLLGSRGCIKHCSYCSAGNAREIYKAQGLASPLMRNRPLDDIMAELILAKKNGAQSISFLDEYFVRPTHSLISFFKEYKEKIGLLFFAHLNAKQLAASDELVDAVVDAGLSHYGLGVQTGCEKFAKDVYNRKNDNAEYLSAIYKLHERHILGNWHYISGNPLETEEAYERTLEFAAKLPFDPSLSRQCYTHSTRLIPLPGSPMVQKYPHIVNFPKDNKKWFRDVVLLQLRTIVGDEEFAVIREDSFYKENPAALQFLLQTITRDKHLAYLEEKAASLAGKDVYFWGCGDIYRYKKHLFRKTKPRGMIVDAAFKRENMVDGIPVITAEEFFASNENLPVVIFMHTAYKVARRIRYYKAQYPCEIISCAMI